MSKAMTQEKLNRALLAAAEEGNPGKMEELLESGAEICSVNEFQNQPLHAAAWGGHREAVELLIARGAGIEAVNDVGCRPLHLAAGRDHMEVAELLVAKGAQIDAPDQYGQTPMRVAAKNGNREVVELLLGHGADPDKAVPAPGDLRRHEGIRVLLKEWNSPENVHKRRQAELAALLARQRKLGALRPKGPAL